jgi:hypothetical protein
VATEVAPRVEKAAKVVTEAAPRVEKAAKVVTEAAPRVEKAAKVVTKAAPRVESPARAVMSRTKVVNEVSKSRRRVNVESPGTARVVGAVVATTRPAAKPVSGVVQPPPSWATCLPRGAI